MSPSALGPNGDGLLRGHVCLIATHFKETRVNVITKYWASQSNANDRRSAALERAWGGARSSEAAAEAIPAQPNCRHRELPATPVRDCDVHHRSLRRHRRGVRDSSIAGLAGERHRAGL